MTTQKFIAYKSVETEVISALRADHHEVFYAPEQDKDFTSYELCQKANQEDYLLLTGDADFANELYHSKSVSSGIIWLDIHENNLVAKAKVVLDTVLNYEDKLKGAFTHITKDTTHQQPINKQP